MWINKRKNPQETVITFENGLKIRVLCDYSGNLKLLEDECGGVVFYQCVFMATVNVSKR